MEEQQEVVQETPTLNQENEVNKAKKKDSKVLLFLIGIFVGTLIAAMVIIIVLFGSGAKFKKRASGEKVITPEVIQKLEKLEEGINAYYLNADELNEESAEEMADQLYHGLVAGLGDPYSTYYNEDELKSMLESTQGVYYGIGAYIGYDSDKDYCKISKCMPGSPAEEAGLQPDDIIVAVDEKDMYKVTTSDIVTYIKGPEHTEVTLKIYREGESDYLDVTLERRKIETPTVAYEIDKDKIAYIQVAEFDEITTSQFAEYLYQAEQDGMKGLIIDLRDNPGGSLTTVVDMASMIVPKGLIVYTEDRYKNRTEYKGKDPGELEVPLVVLVNGNSASASEIFAGAVQDYGKGTILGTQTFGKGIVQKIFALDDGTAVKLTISHYYTPNGNDIHKIGITPDEVLELDVDAYLKNKKDNQLDRAKEILKEQIK